MAPVSTRFSARLKKGGGKEENPTTVRKITKNYIGVAKRSNARKSGARSGAGNAPRNKNPPRVDTPTVATPRVATPTLEVPRVATPTLEVPRVDTPSVEEPRVHTPTEEEPRETKPIVDNLGEMPPAFEDLREPEPPVGNGQFANDYQHDLVVRYPAPNEAPPIIMPGPVHCPCLDQIRALQNENENQHLLIIDLERENADLRHQIDILSQRQQHFHANYTPPGMANGLPNGLPNGFPGGAPNGMRDIMPGGNPATGVPFGFPAAGMPMREPEPLNHLNMIFGQYMLALQLAQQQAARGGRL